MDTAGPFCVWANKLIIGSRFGVRTWLWPPPQPVATLLSQNFQVFKFLDNAKILLQRLKALADLLNALIVHVA